MTIHLGCALPCAPRCDQPGRRSGKAIPSPCGPCAAPIRSCSRWGLPCRPCRQVRGALLPHPFTLARGLAPERFAFCGTFPGVAPAGHYPAPYFRGARTFLQRSPFGTRVSGHPADWRFDHSYMALPDGSVQWRERPSSAVSRRARVAQVERSARPSTRAWRKWRWKALTVTSVATSKRPVCGTS